MKVIFLDIDGVLNSPATWALKELNDPLNKGVDQIDYSMLGLLSRIVSRTNAKIVISSTWRKIHSLDEIHDMFVARGWQHPRDTIIDRTPSSSHGFRGEEIKSWLDNHEVQDYIILDDDSDMLPSQNNRFINTCGYVGLTYLEVRRAIALLNNDSDDHLKANLEYSKYQCKNRIVASTQCWKDKKERLNLSE